LGWPQNYFFDHVDVEIQKAIEAVARFYEGAGARVIPVDVGFFHQTTDPSTAMALAEAREWHQAQGYFPARAAEYGEDVRKRLEMGADVRAVDYLDAWQILAATHAACESLFGTVHAVLAPVTPVAATPIGTKVITLAGHEEPVRSALLRLCRPANFAHLPAISLPCGFTAGRLPIGLQLIGPRYGEESLCAVARVYEQAHAWRQARPELAS
jgi:aspartyl-tRNA(Asn)/glutamyl-tRNA(Gln) amidotransferase subunit A